MDKYFDVSGLAPSRGVFRLTGAEYHHSVRVSRIRVGESVRLLDGKGGTYEARVERLDESETVLRVTSYEKKPGPPHVDMALALLKASRFDIAVEKCSELGLRSFVPFRSERCVWRGGAEEAGRKQERIQRKVLAACKQSGQAHFPSVLKAVSFEMLLDLLPSYSTVLVADAGGRSPAEELGLSGTASTLGIVGPEGGLSPAERERLAQRGVVTVSLGASRLRSETAAICLLYRILAETCRSGGSEPR